MTAPPPLVRAFYWAARVAGAPAPFDTAHLKIYYPAHPAGSEAERMSGMLSADRARAPYPVVIFAPGVNVNPESYRWLATALVERGLVVVMASWVCELLPGSYGIGAGIDIDALRPDTYGKIPPLVLLPAVVDALRAVQTSERAPLHGLLDLDRIIAGGHSAGGSAALQAGCRRFYPSVAAAFAYGAHSGMATMLGWPPATIAPLAADCPLLLLGGTRDGVIAASSSRYGVAESPMSPIVRTFDEAITGGRNDAYLVVVDGANHFAIADPLDPTSARGFLDEPATEPEQARALIGRAIALFLQAHVLADPGAAAELGALVTSPPAGIALVRRK